MRYSRFVIDCYRAIEHGEVAVSNNLIPVIGVNESGKTTLLQAVLAFDKNKDRYLKGAHLEHKNKYEIEDRQGSIAAHVLMENDTDLERVAENMNLTVGDSLYKKLQSLYTDKKSVVLVRSFPSRKYSVANDEFKDTTKALREKLALAFYDRLPFILYFDDFNDRVPETIEFNLKRDVPQGYEVPKGANNEEWNSILEEVFKRTSAGKLSLTTFLGLKADDRESLVNDIQDTLHKEVVEDWKNLKKRFGPDFGEETEALQLKLNWDIADDNSKVTFRFKVEDSTTGRKRPFDVTQRSKGFQWFFNFIMKLKFNPKYQADQKGAIYLLDEPGSYLHTSAQEELLKKLQEISDTNTILYCTHSQYLLDPEVINIARILIANKDSGKISILPYGTADVSRNEGALTPLNRALHIKSGFFNKDIKYPVITEGITDFYLFNLLKKYRKDFFDAKIDFIPGAGADHLKDLLSHAIAFSDKYLLFLDSDEKGRRAFEKYRSYFGDDEARSFFTYSIPGKATEVQLEDHLSDDDQKRLQGITAVGDVKAAFPVLYYSEEEKIKEFIENLDAVSLKNLEVIQGKVGALTKKKK